VSPQEEARQATLSIFVTSRFRRAMDRLLRKEGGYSDHPNDHGGRTRYGISQAAYPHLNIPALTVDDAMQTYNRDYWAPLHLDEFASEEVAQAVFDMGVNAGIVRAAKILQESLNGLGKPVSADGRIGRATLAQANSVPEELLLDQFRRDSMRFYERIVQNDSTQAVFLSGWRNRIYGETA